MRAWHGKELLEERNRWFCHTVLSCDVIQRQKLVRRRTVHPKEGAFQWETTLALLLLLVWSLDQLGYL